VRHVRAWLTFWLALFWLWMLLVGEWNHIEWIAGASAAAIAASLAEAARTRAHAGVRVPLEWIGKAATALPMVFVDFGIVMLALFRRQRGTFVRRSFPGGGDDPVSVGVRAWATLMATYSPNAYVIDIDANKDVVLLHDLVPFRRSEEPAGG